MSGACPLLSNNGQIVAVPRLSALCHVWTAPGSQELSSRLQHVWTAPGWQELSSRLQHWSVQPCVRPLSAAHKAAGHNALRGSGPGQKHAFDNALAQVGCPDRRIDRLCITCCSPSQPSHHAGYPARSRLRRKCDRFPVAFAFGHHCPVGRLRVGKTFFTFAALVGAAMCSAFKCGTQGRWPKCPPRIRSRSNARIRQCAGTSGLS